MSDVMRVQPFETLLRWSLAELGQNESLFGIHRSLFYTPKEDSVYATEMFGDTLATPIGPGAGPHTQLTQNILAAWLSGGRFIELKTVQIMDDLEIPRPCIDMADEGYNVEWSQELKLDQSAWEYIKAWVLIHVLRRVLGFEGEVPFGTIFNMSVGYDLEGIQSPPMTRFMDHLEDASEEIAELQDILKAEFPRLSDIEIPSRIVNSVTLSTMHGCPPDEIEEISQHLMEERGLHTFVKLNPTLLGKERVMEILNDRLGFTEIRIPDEVFEHDLQYGQAVALIESLKQVADACNLTFGVKLSNTLAMANHRDVLPGDEVYMSGRALYPITMALFHQLAEEFERGSSTESDRGLDVSYSAGADALNVSAILSCGALPVTAVSDLLKPGGYSRFVQYLENLEREMRDRGAGSLEELARDRRTNLEREAARALEDERYKKAYHPYELPKVESGLGLFDCIVAPCRYQCAVLQDVPEYAWLIAQGEYDRALEVVLYRNPLPNVTGYVCDHLCQTRCTRSNYDDPVAIRALKRFAAERGSATLRAAEPSGQRVAIIGGGPSGLAAAYFLALSGVKPVVYEARDRAGGMPAIAPEFRLPERVVQEDVERIKELGAEINLSHPIADAPESLLEQDFDAVYVASGAQEDARLGVEGEDGEGIYHALDLLEHVNRGEMVPIDGDVLVIGGGNTAMDAARTAKRLTDGRVTVVYRRTSEQMPADDEEIEAIFAEDIGLEELVSPTRFILEYGRVVALECIRNELGEPGPDGRRRPVAVEGSEFQMRAKNGGRLQVIVAIGQRPDISFLDGSGVSLNSGKRIDVDPETGRATGREAIYAGGDAVRGPATIIEACSDGQRAAEAICDRLGVRFRRPSVELPTLSAEEIVKVKHVRARRKAQQEPQMLPPEARDGFDLVEQTLPEEVARAEGERCMQCSHLCDKCVEVCPNRANYTYLMSPVKMKVPTLACKDGELRVVGEETFHVAQTRQILHVDDFCNDCGNCRTFCVHNGRPFADKPRLFLNEDDFEREDDNAFYIRREEQGWTMRRREGGEESRLTLEQGQGGMTFENRRLSLQVGPDSDTRSMTLKESFEGVFSLKPVAEMVVILEGVLRTLPFVLVGQG
jgi:putative selenate reductase